MAVPPTTPLGLTQNVRSRKRESDDDDDDDDVMVWMFKVLLHLATVRRIAILLVTSTIGTRVKLFSAVSRLGTSLLISTVHKTPIGPNRDNLTALSHG